MKLDYVVNSDTTDQQASQREKKCKKLRFMKVWLLIYVNTNSFLPSSRGRGRGYMSSIYVHSLQCSWDPNYEKKKQLTSNTIFMAMSAHGGNLVLNI